MKTITYDEIKALNPCYDPIKFISSDFNGTLIQILRMKKVPAKDRLWVIVRHTLMSDKQLHLYGLACARMAEKYTTDKRIKACNNIVKKFLNGKASLEELHTAARSAAESAESAESAAAASAARSAASAAWSAAWSAASAARSAAEEKQCLALIKILKENN
jgi:hypothetical protein